MGREVVLEAENRYVIVGGFGRRMNGDDLQYRKCLSVRAA